jgi:hypothetical protein
VNVASSVNEITRKNSGSTHFPSIRRRALFFKVHHTTWCETPTWNASLRVLVPGFASTASKIWERSLLRSFVLGWDFPGSPNRCTVEINVFQLGLETVPGTVFALRLHWLPPHCTRVSEFGILNDLITNTLLSAPFVELQLITSDKKILFCHTKSV